ncbi:MAG: EthD family reductase [Planctomycetes bacterium]|nr:EthD family reductase [Planctomycetota bacterium]
MFRMHAVFPAGEGATFDWDSYVKNHLPLAREKMKPHGLISINAQRCAPGPDGAQPTNLAIVTINFESAERFNAAFADVAPELIAHVPTFSNVKPIFHFGEVAD